jgi:hypothetical protein
VFHGQGGYNYVTVYNMPLWLRKYTFQIIKEWYDNSKPDENGASWVSSVAKEEASKNKKINVPTYVTKASKK